MISSQEVLINVNRLQAQGYEATEFPNPRSILQYREFEKVYVDVDSLKVVEKVWQPIVDHYATLPTDFPPIVIGENNEILDGKHRVAAAQKRGDRTIAAYKPLY